MRSEKEPRTAEGDVNQSPGREWWSEHHLPEATRRVLEEDARFFLHQSLSTPCLNVLEHAEGTTITDLEGRAFLDFHGNSVHQVGHANPRVIEAVKNQLDTLSFCPRRYTNLPAVALASRLARLAPGDLNRVLLAPGGTSAVGMALKLARVVTGRFKTLSMWGAFHGASLDAVSVGGEAQFRAGIGPLLPGTEHVPPAEPFRCRFAPRGGCGDCGLKCAEFVEYALEKEGDVAAVIAEPIRCTTVDLPPPGYWRRVRSACDLHGALLIFDETAVCLGRTGRMLACEHFDVVPDILILGKGLGGGVFPLAAIVAREAFNVAGHMALGHYTHEKSPVACAAALAALDCIEEEGLLERSRSLGERALQGLVAMRRAHPLVGDVRGMGLLLAVELTRPDGGPASREADEILYQCLARGLSFKVSSGNILTLTPPLTVSEAEWLAAMRIIESALTEVETRRLSEKSRARSLFSDKLPGHHSLPTTPTPSNPERISMDFDQLPENPYLLLTPGPLSTTRTVKAAMLRDWCTWDDDYNGIVQDIRSRLVAMATEAPGYTAVLMQGSGTFTVEATLGSVVPKDGKVLVIANGHYGERIGRITRVLGIPTILLDFGEVGYPDLHRVESALKTHPDLTHLAVVHCETTTGMLNPVADICRLARSFNKTTIVDAMSSFGGIPMDADAMGADYVISSANKCIQGVPGFGFVIARRRELEECEGRARSLSLDLHDQWREMETRGGKWRFTSPTHVVRAFAQALSELEEEGGIAARHARYAANHRVLVEGMEELGFRCLLPEPCRSPVITAFFNPPHPAFAFKPFYSRLKSEGFVIYPGKVTSADTFRIGNIGHVFPDDMKRLVRAVHSAMTWK